MKVGTIVKDKKQENPRLLVLHKQDFQSKEDALICMQEATSNFVSFCARGLCLDALPTSLKMMEHLTSIDLSDNRLTDFPRCLSSATKSLITLNLSDNLITHIPNAAISCFSSLRTLLLRNNRLNGVPSAISELKSLSCVDLEGNPLISFPQPPEYPVLMSGISTDLELNTTQVLEQATKLTKEGCCSWNRLQVVALGCDEDERQRVFDVVFPQTKVPSSCYDQSLCSFDEEMESAGTSPVTTTSRVCGTEESMFLVRLFSLSIVPVTPVFDAILNPSAVFLVIFEYDESLEIMEAAAERVLKQLTASSPTVPRKVVLVATHRDVDDMIINEKISHISEDLSPKFDRVSFSRTFAVNVSSSNPTSNQEQCDFSFWISHIPYPKVSGAVPAVHQMLRSMSLSHCCPSVSSLKHVANDVGLATSSAIDNVLDILYRTGTIVVISHEENDKKLRDKDRTTFLDPALFVETVCQISRDIGPKETKDKLWRHMGYADMMPNLGYDDFFEKDVEQTSEEESKEKSETLPFGIERHIPFISSFQRFTADTPRVSPFSCMCNTDKFAYIGTRHGMVHLWDVAKRRQIATASLLGNSSSSSSSMAVSLFQGKNTDSITALCCVGNTLWVGTSEFGGTVRVWMHAGDIENTTFIPLCSVSLCSIDFLSVGKLKPPSSIVCIEGPSGPRIWFSCPGLESDMDGVIAEYDPLTLQLLRTIQIPYGGPTSMTPLTCSSDEMFLGLGTQQGYVVLIDGVKGTVCNSFDLFEGQETRGPISSLCFANNKTLWCCSNETKKVAVIDVNDPCDKSVKPVFLEQKCSAVLSSPAHTRFIVGYYRDSLFSWDCDTKTIAEQIYLNARITFFSAVASSEPYSCDKLWLFTRTPSILIIGTSRDFEFRKPIPLAAPKDVPHHWSHLAESSITNKSLDDRHTHILIKKIGVQEMRVSSIRSAAFSDTQNPGNVYFGSALPGSVPQSFSRCVFTYTVASKLADLLGGILWSEHAKLPLGTASIFLPGFTDPVPVASQRVSIIARASTPDDISAISESVALALCNCYGQAVTLLTPDASKQLASCAVRLIADGCLLLQQHKLAIPKELIPFRSFTDFSLRVVGVLDDSKFIETTLEPLKLTDKFILQKSPFRISKLSLVVRRKGVSGDIDPSLKCPERQGTVSIARLQGFEVPLK